FSVTTVEDFRSWLWFHFILDAGLMVGIRQAGGVEAFVRSPASAKLTLRLIREMLPALEAKGGVPTLGPKAIRLLPTGPVAFGLRKRSGGGSVSGALTRDARRGAQGSWRLLDASPRAALAASRRREVPTPQLAALAPMFRCTRAAAIRASVRCAQTAGSAQGGRTSTDPDGHAPRP